MLIRSIGWVRAGFSRLFVGDKIRREPAPTRLMLIRTIGWVRAGFSRLFVGDKIRREPAPQSVWNYDRPPKTNSSIAAATPSSSTSGAIQLAPAFTSEGALPIATPTPA
jgi:hypothetical protein